MIGIWMSQFAIGWLVVELSVRDGRPDLAPLSIGIIGLSRSVPSLVLGLFAGALADRVDRRRVLLIAASANAVNVTLVAALVVTGLINVPWLIATGCVASVTHAFDTPARQALLSQLVPRAALVSAIGLNSAALNNAILLGPIVGGVLIGPLGTGGVVSLWALSSVIVVGALAGVRRMPQPEAPASSMLGAIREGLGYIRDEPVVRTTLLLFMAAALLGRAYLFLLPALAHNDLHLGAVETSWLLAGSGAGALAGSFATAALGGVARRGIVFCIAAIVAGTTLVALGAQQSLWPALVLLGVTSFAFSILMGMVQTIVQTRTPDALRGRVLGITQMSFFGLVPLGTLAVGSLGAVVGSGVAISVGGGLLALVALGMLALARPLKRLGLEAPAAVPRRAGAE